MAKQKRKAPKSKPVTQHPLFPAVIALWFGALFGLGSLAVRPSLLEELVIKSRIDLLVPAAAPPLGMTARMLVALVLAALGAMLGAAIARRIARPKQEVRERKRTNLSTRDEGAGISTFDAYADASTRHPGPGHEGSGDGAAPRVLAGRRRSLAIEHEVGDYVPQDMAPLPGGAPQIFDISSAGLNDAQAEEPASPEPGSLAQPAIVPAPTPAPVALDWANAAPVLPPVAGLVPALLPQAIEAQRQVFQPTAPVAQVPLPVEPVFALTPAPPAPADARQVFGMTPPLAPPADQPRQIFGAPVIDDHVPKEFVEAQGFRTTVFETPQPSPLFAPRAEAAPTAPEPVHAPLPAAVPEAYVPPAEAVVPAPLEEPAPAALVLEAAPAPALPSPASLGIEDLSARLAESMRRRREARTVAPAEAVSEPVAEAVLALAPAAAPAPVAQIFEPAALPPQSEPEVATVTVPAFSVPPFVVPRFTVPAAAEPAEPLAAAPPITAVEAPPPIPAGLRPLDLAGFEEEDQAEQASLLPPRRIFLPVEAAPAPTFVPPAAEPEAFATPVVTPAEVEPEAAEEAVVAEENYASLLAVAPSPASQRNPFVRVEEPEALAETVEPVVIFPGQAMPAPQPFAPLAAVGVEEAVPFRRFDSPSSAGQGQPSAVNDAASALPPEETERALRSALANLQRMSGAA